MSIEEIKNETNNKIFFLEFKLSDAMQYFEHETNQDKKNYFYEEHLKIKREIEYYLAIQKVLENLKD